jgi:MFS family permease
VLAGLCISGGGGLVLLAQGGLGVVYMAMFLLGLGQGLSIAAQSSLVAEMCVEAIRRHGSGAVYGVYRLVERLGNAGGPLLAGLLVASLDYRGAFAAIGALVLASGVLFALGSGALRRPVPAD